MDRPDTRRLGRKRRRPEALHGRLVGTERGGRADRARRPHLARGRRLRPRATPMPSAFIEHDFAHREALAATLAGDVAELLRAAIGARNAATLALSGGTTPQRF